MKKNQEGIADYLDWKCDRAKEINNLYLLVRGGIRGSFGAVLSREITEASRSGGSV